MQGIDIHIDKTSEELITLIKGSRFVSIETSAEYKETCAVLGNLVIQTLARQYPALWNVEEEED